MNEEKVIITKCMNCKKDIYNTEGYFIVNGKEYCEYCYKKLFL